MSIDFSTERKPLSTFSLAGLADIVLLLLIFFLLTSSFVPHFGIQVNLPRTDTSVPTNTQYMTVVVTKEGEFYVEQAPVEREQLLIAVQNAQRDREVLVLRADQDATVRNFAAVASVARALNMRFLMATDRSQSGF